VNEGIALPTSRGAFVNIQVHRATVSHTINKSWGEEPVLRAPLLEAGFTAAMASMRRGRKPSATLLDEPGRGWREMD